MKLKIKLSHKLTSVAQLVRASVSGLCHDARHRFDPQPSRDFLSVPITCTVIMSSLYNNSYGYQPSAQTYRDGQNKIKICYKTCFNKPKYFEQLCLMVKNCSIQCSSWNNLRSSFGKNRIINHNRTTSFSTTSNILFFSLLSIYLFSM